MNLLLLLAFLSLFTMEHPNSQDSHTIEPCSGQEISLDTFRWKNRILVLFAPHSEHESYQTQMNTFSSLHNELRDRDLILFSIFDTECSMMNDEIITESSSQSIRERLNPDRDSNTYSIYLIGKDGGVKLIKDEVLEPTELFRVIDRMPMRQREMRESG